MTADMHAPVERPAVDPRELRSAMGMFATGVTVVTNAAGDGVHAMTANAFMSVSLDPPLVLVSLGNGAKMTARLHEHDRYGVSVLAHSQESLARRFAGVTNSAAPQFVWISGTPLIASALVHVGVRIIDRHPAGDHTLFIGEVEHIATRRAEPLIFHTGTFTLLQVGVSESYWNG